MPTQVIGAVAAVRAAWVRPPALATTEATSVWPASARVGLYDAPVAPAMGEQSRPFALHRSHVVSVRARLRRPDARGDAERAPDPGGARDGGDRGGSQGRAGVRDGSHEACVRDRGARGVGHANGHPDRLAGVLRRHRIGAGRRAPGEGAVGSVLVAAIPPVRERGGADALPDPRVGGQLLADDGIAPDGRAE